MTEAVENGVQTTTIKEARAANPNRLFVGNLTYQTRESELKDFCEKMGKV